MTTTTPRVTAVLKLPTHVPDLIKLGQSIVQAMTGNASFPNPTPPLANVSAAIAALDAAETATKTRAKGTIPVRNTARAAVLAALRDLKVYVQQVSDANHAQAETIIASALMNVRKVAVHTKPDFTAKAGAASASVRLVAKAAARRASYEWQWSADGGKTWTLAATTLQSKTTIGALPLGVSCQFRYRPVTKTGEADWSQAVAMIVK
jgi:hypothetical protein